MSPVQKILLFFTLPYWIIVGILWCSRGHTEPPGWKRSPPQVQDTGREARANQAVGEAGANPRYKIAIIGTGYDPARAHIPAKLCATGHYDFFTRTANVAFYHAHETAVTDIIADKLRDVDYCFIIFQVYTATQDKVIGADPSDIAKAVNDIVGLHVTAVNMSSDGPEATKDEREAFKNLETIGTPVFLAAGNKSSNLDVKCNSYPGCYGFSNLIMVGMQDEDSPKKHAQMSNYGNKVKIWAPGYYKMGDETEWRSGTSFAAPRALADYILFLEHKRLQGARKKK